MNSDAAAYILLTASNNCGCSNNYNLSAADIIALGFLFGILAAIILAIRAIDR